MNTEMRSRPTSRLGRRFAWYGRLSTKDKQDPTLSFPSQREACAKKAAELEGEIVCDFTDQEAGRRDDRAGWAELLREAKEPEARRFDAVIIYSTSRLSRDLFHALTYEREMTRAGVEVFYALTAGDQTSPEGRLIRHMFQALDQFEVEKLGREVRRGQKENTRQGYRNGGRAPYGYRLRHEAHPDPARAKAGDTKSRLVLDRERAPVVAEIFERFLAGAGYKEIANELNRPSGPPPPSHVDSKRNTSGKWAKTTIKSMLENPVYTGRLYWNRLDSRAQKQGAGPRVRRDPDEWIEAAQRHDALVSDEQFKRTQVEMKRRSNAHGGRRRPQQRFYLLRGIVHCATGHNPLRMQGRARKGEPTYYTCGYRAAYGDRAAEAVGHGKWQYVREDTALPLIDAFFTTRIFGPESAAHFRAEHPALANELRTRDDAKRERAGRRLSELEQRIERQLAAIEAGVDPVLVGKRIRALKVERQEAEAVLAQLEASRPRGNDGLDLDQACALLAGLPDLRKPLQGADPELRRAVFDAFRLRVEIDRNAGQARLKAVVSSAFCDAKDLTDIGTAGNPALSDKAIRLIGALSKSETSDRLARLNRLRRKLLQDAASSPRQSTPPPPRTGELPRVIAEVLAGAAEPMHVSDIQDAVERLLGRPVNYRSVKGRLSEGTMLRRPRFERVARGYYRLRG
ncbi:MAG TPA: recombinase family protein [Solirubrobacterales bacterium]